jgi:CO/xanthine dehydrogenase FAD-binding subunit
MYEEVISEEFRRLGAFTSFSEIGRDERPRRLYKALAESEKIFSDKSSRSY